jgi:hypothetical protein
VSFDRVGDVGMDVVAAHELEESVAFQDVQDLGLDPGQAHVDVGV